LLDFIYGRVSTVTGGRRVIMLPEMSIYINPWLLALAIVLVVVIIAVAIVLSVRTHKGKIATGQENLVGRKAVVRTALDPKGEVFVEDELWSAEIEGGTAAPEEEVIVTRVEGLKLYVTRK
jgi:membrane protein implicated in regulation of membrane protease activity